MSRSIDFSQPLSAEDREYVQARPWLYRGRQFEDLEFEDDDLVNPDSEDLDDDDSEDLSDSDDDESDEDEDLDDEDEDDDVDLEDLTVKELRELANERGVEVPKKSTKDDLIDLLS